MCDLGIKRYARNKIGENGLKRGLDERTEYRIGLVETF